jgi:hypothetical protein
MEGVQVWVLEILNPHDQLLNQFHRICFPLSDWMRFLNCVPQSVQSSKTVVRLDPWLVAKSQGFFQSPLEILDQDRRGELN